MNTAEALAQYDSKAEAFHRARLTILQGGHATLRFPRQVLRKDLDGYPPAPKVVWIVRPPGYSGDGSLPHGAHKFSSRVAVNSAQGVLYFRGGSGRSTVGRNALRHGRINWAETVRRYSEWYDHSQALDMEFNRACQEIQDKWRLWVWEQTDEGRIYHQQGHLWYSLMAHYLPGAYATVHSAYEKADLYKGFAEHIASAARLTEVYPFLVPLLTNFVPKVRP
jgi:hypothetical protein